MFKDGVQMGLNRYSNSFTGRFAAENFSDDKKLLDVLGCPLNPMRNPSHQWINEALYLKYPEPVDVIREY